MTPESRSNKRKKNQQSLHELVRSIRRRRLIRIAFGIAIGIPVGLALAAIITLWITGSHRNVPDWVLATGDIRLISAALRGDGPQQQWFLSIPGGRSSMRTTSPDDPFTLPFDSATIASLELPPPPAALREAADLWTKTINELNPGAILHYEVDSYGNLYVYPGYWFYQNSTLAYYADVAEQFAYYWQAYLADNFGDFAEDGATASDLEFRPGVVIVDCQGEVARSMDGYTRVLRLPTTCD